MNTPLSIPKNKKEEMQIYMELCDFLYENKELFLSIYGKNGDPGFSRKLINKVFLWTQDMNKMAIMNYKYETEQKYAIIYLLEGTMEIIYEWLKDDCPITIEEMGNLLYRLNYEGINSKK